jgi:hypothetical protein
VKTIDLADPRWLEFVSSRPDANLFHHPAWAQLLADCYGYRAKVVALTDDGRGVLAGLPVIDVSLPFGRRRWMSLPFTDYCAPLADGPELVAGLREVARSFKLDSLQIRAALPPDPGVQSEAGFVRHAVPLTPDTAATWKRLRRNHRRSIADAEEAGARIVRGTSEDDLDAFYRIHLQTRRRLGVPVQPRRFFRMLLERIIRPGLGFILTAYLGDRPAAAGVFCSWNGTLMCKYSGRADGLTRLDAIHLLYWHAMREGSADHHTFDLGRSETEQSQLRSFKIGWGAQETPLAYSWIARSPIRPASHRAHDVLGVVIRNSKPWLCRATGELLYRYAP